jgi:hypothetical protein
MSGATQADTQSERHTALLIGFVAAAAGVALASYLYWWRIRSMRNRPSGLASVSDILTECNAKMREIQSHLSALSTAD